MGNVTVPLAVGAVAHGFFALVFAAYLVIDKDSSRAQQSIIASAAAVVLATGAVNAAHALEGVTIANVPDVYLLTWATYGVGTCRPHTPGCPRFRLTRRARAHTGTLSACF